MSVQNDFFADPDELEEAIDGLPEANDMDSVPNEEEHLDNFGELPQVGSRAGSVVWNVVDLGLQGRVPSHVSVASDATSVVATSKYFGITRRSPAEINARRVICPKDARGAPGSRDYTRHQESATKALPHIFVSAKHFHAKNSDGEAYNKYTNLQSEYAGNLAKIKSFKRHMDSWDMSDPFVIPKLKNPSALSVEDCWAERKTTGMNLLRHWERLSLSQCKNWQRDSLNYASLDDLTSMEWAKTLMMNSCDALLVERIDEKFDELRPDEQGGVMYIKLALDEMFTVSTTVVNTLQGFFENFAKEGIAKVPNEDVRLATKQILAVAERLAEVSALPTEVTVQILEGFTRCSVPIFKQTFSHLLVGERLKQLRTLTCLSLHDNTRLGGIRTLCKEANDMFNSLNISKEWNIPQARRTDALVVPCFNCGDPKHGVPKCPKPLDQARIDKAKSEFIKNGGGRNERNKGFRNRDSERRGGGAGTSSNKNYNQGKWKGDTKATNASIPYDSGVGFHNGQWCMMCRK